LVGASIEHKNIFNVDGSEKLKLGVKSGRRERERERERTEAGKTQRCA